MALLLLVFTACLGSLPTEPRNPPPPPEPPGDPNEPMYGTWNGTLDMFHPVVDPPQVPMTVYIEKDSLAVRVSNSPFAIQLLGLSPDSISFNLSTTKRDYLFVGVRVDSTLSGSVTAAGVEPGTFVLARIPTGLAAAIRHTGPADAPRSRYRTSGGDGLRQSPEPALWSAP